MSKLTLYSEQQPTNPINIVTTTNEIAEILQQVGVLFEKWHAEIPIQAGDDQAQILQAYAGSIQALQKIGGYTTSDVVSLYPGHPDKDAFRAKFLSEHTHAEDEVRFFVKGKGLFCLSIQGQIYAVLCEQGDLISVPKGITHWFDMGSEPEFTCIRLFIDPAGWVAEFTGRDIAAQVPNMDQA